MPLTGERASLDKFEFFQHVLPTSGPYCIAIYKPKPDGTKGPFYHYAAEDLSEAVSIAEEQDRRGEEVYFAIGSLIKARIWDDKQQRLRTRRTGDNIRGLRVYTMDMDAGNGRAYATTEDAVSALVFFCKHNKMPRPTVVQSGFGLHIYWTLTHEVPQAEWEENGKTLAAMARASGVKFDSGRSTDSSTVLRVVGTRNNKYAERPLVTTLCVGAITDTTRFHQLLGIHVSPSPLDANPGIDFGSNTNRYEKTFLSPKLLATGCAAFRRAIDPANQARGSDGVPEPAWMCAVMLATHCTSGRDVAHTISNQDPRYDSAYVDAQFDRWTGAGMGPTTCARFQKVWQDFDGENVCSGCPSEGKITSPAVIAHHVAKAPPLIVSDVTPTGVVVQREIPDPPAPFQRTIHGIGVRTANTKTNADETVIFCRYDMYPSRMQYDEVSMIEEGVLWKVNMPHEGWVDLEIPHVAKMQIPLTLAKRGIYLDDHQANYMASFMSNYVRKLQTEIPREMAYAKMGWRKGGFVVGDTLYRGDGEFELHAMSRTLEQATQGGMVVEGELSAWKRAVQIYNRPGLEAFRMFIYSSLASPLYTMTGQVATVLNATGIGGIGKSTVMDIAAAMWGNPRGLVMRNQTRAAAEIITNGLNNLPVMIDEITTREVKEMAEFIFDYSGGKGKLRSQSGGGIRADTATWSNLCMTNANTDVYASMASVHTDSAPHMMRLIQLEFPVTTAITKREADTARLLAFDNYGHAGRHFASYAAQNEMDLRKRVARYSDEADKRVNAKSEERYWTAWIASVRAAAEIASSLGMLPGFTVSNDIEWMYRQIDVLREITQEQIENAEGMLSSFLDEQLPNTLIVSAKNSGNIDNVANEPRGELHVRMELDTGITIISRKAIQDYCVKKNINLSRRLEELFGRQIVINKNVTHVLGAHTKFAGGRVRCIVVNANRLRGALAVVPTTVPSATLIAAAGSVI